MPADQKNSSKSKWKDMNRFRELDYLFLHLETLLNRDYLQTTCEHRIKFDLNQKIVCFSDGLYYSATIENIYRLGIPDSLYPEGSVVPVERRVATYIPKFLRWPSSQSRPEHFREVPENEIISCRLNDPVAIMGMLAAHCWNTFKRNEAGLSEEQMGPGVWFLDDEEYLQLEQKWRENWKETVTFSEFCTGLFQKKSAVATATSEEAE